MEKAKVIGPVYHISRNDSDATYMGETEQSLKIHFSEPWRKSSVGSEVSQHVHVDRLQDGVSLDKLMTLKVTNREVERGVMEEIYTSVAKMSINKNGGLYLLPAV